MSVKQASAWKHNHTSCIMIQEALKAVVGDLNGALRRQLGDSHDRVVLSSLSSPAGGGADEVGDKICCVLTQITEEKNIASMAAPKQVPAAVQPLSAPISLNLQLLFAAQCSRYEVGLQMISQVIACLHSKPLFTPANTPAMGRGLDRLTLEMVKISLAEQSSLWGMLGASYSPSVLYSMRVLTFGGGQISALDPGVNRPTVNSPPQ